MPDGNFVKIDRKILSWGWYTDVSTKCLFLHCILRANWKPGEWKGIRYERGQFITSLSNLSHETGLSVKQVRTALKHLKETNEVASYSTSKFTVITVTNYDKYQTVGKVEGKQGANQGQSEGKQGASKGQQYKKEKNNKEGKKEKKEYICAEPLQASTPEPEEPAVISLPLNDKTWYSITQKQVDEWSGLYPAVDVMQELRKMLGWLDASPSNRKTRRGIKSFVNRWLSKEQDRGGSRQRRQPPAPSTRQPEQDEETRRFIEASEALTDAFVRGEIT